MTDDNAIRLLELLTEYANIPDHEDPPSRLTVSEVAEDLMHSLISDDIPEGCDILVS